MSSHVGQRYLDGSEEQTSQKLSMFTRQSKTPCRSRLSHLSNDPSSSVTAKRNPAVANNEIREEKK